MDLVILQKMASYCAYQERTHQEVRDKLRKLGIWGEEAEEIVAELIVRNYLNEERFAKTYAGGKSRIKHWGKLRIRQELKKKGVSDYSIEEGMREISEQDYQEGLERLLEKKLHSLQKTEQDSRTLEMKLTRYAVGKGYEFELVRPIIRKILS